MNRKQLIMMKRAAKRVEAKARKYDRWANSKSTPLYFEDEDAALYAEDARDLRTIARNLKRGNLQGIRRIIQRIDTVVREDALSVMPRSIYFGW